MKKHWLVVLSLAGWLAVASAAIAQPRPYIGFVYPAGGQQGTTFQIRLGGQGLDETTAVLVSGPGVQAKLVANFRRLGNQETSLLREQLSELRRDFPAAAKVLAPPPPPSSKAARPASTAAAPLSEKEEEALEMMRKIQRRFDEYVNTPACASIASLMFVEVTVAADAPPGPRELRLCTLRGVSNPLVFYVGQVPEFCRKPMLSAMLQVLGKEELAQRKRPPEEVEQRVTVPCVMNGQIASGEVNVYRFEARKSQRLVISTTARQLIPYMADGVPGWFQPVLAVYDAEGNELAYNDDYRFKPDPVIYFEAPEDGEYVLTITDAIFRGREDFVYRVTIGELPMITSIFPLGAKAGTTAKIDMKGWNVDGAKISPPPPDAPPGVYWLTARQGKFVSNRIPFAVDSLPECVETEPNNDRAAPQKVELPIIVNGRVNQPDDWDVYQFSGRAGDTVVVEVQARRLESPLDSVIKLTDPSGKLLAFSDDVEDPAAGTNTHHADSYLMVKLPADGDYCVHLGDAAQSGSEEYGYRLRISAPQPDFALRVVPSSTALRSKASAAVDVHVIRKDGFDGPIKLDLKDPPQGFVASPATLTGAQKMIRLTLKTDLAETKEPVALQVRGTAKVGDAQIERVAVPAEDRMQAFLWRHLVPAEELKVLVYDPAYRPPPKRPTRVKLPEF